MSHHILTVSGLTVRAGRRSLIEDISISVNEGDFIALMGANGSGKTTLIRAILGFVRPYSGEVRLFDSIINRRNIKGLRSMIGYVPQTLRIDFKMPFLVREVVAIGRYGLAGTGRRLTQKDHASIDSALEEIGISHLAERPFGHLSGGERQKVQIARAICQGSHLLFLDEPANNLDMGAQRDLFDLLSKVNARGIGVLMVMHDIHDLPSGVTRAIIISRGRKGFEGPVEDALKRGPLSLIYGDRTDDVISWINKRGKGSRS